mgnify:CR=1 FL=1
MTTLSVDYVLQISLVMLVSGFVGGLINFILAGPEQDRVLPWWKHVVVGIGASFLVPLFLQMISSDLISRISGADGKKSDASALLVLTGFCLVASISARGFISSMSKRLLQELERVKADAQNAAQQAQSAAQQAQVAERKAEAAQSVVAPLVEPEEGEPTQESVAVGSAPASDDERRVLEALEVSRFRLRSAGGIAGDSKLSNEKVDEALSSLAARGLVAKGQSLTGQARWYLAAAKRI